MSSGTERQATGRGHRGRVGPRRALRAAAAGGVALSAGCVGILRRPPVDAVDVALVHVGAPNVGATSLTMPTVLEFHDTAASAVPDVSVDCDVFVNSEPVASAETAVGSLDPGERDAARLNAIVYYADVAATILTVLERGGFRLRLDGVLRSTGPVLSASRAFRVSSRV